MNRKEFLSSILGLAIVPAVGSAIASASPRPQNNRVSDEEFWTKVRNQFVFDQNSIDFLANAASPMPQTTISQFVTDYQYIESFPSDRSSAMTSDAVERLRGKLARQINCATTEIAVMRNTTEALNNAIMGLPMSKGDEVVASAHEYDSMMASFYQRKITDGISIKQINIPYTVSSVEEIVALWKRAITQKTKVFLISQMVWISGQIYPVKEICELAREHNILTVVDAAQSFSHIKIDVRDLGCDYLGASLHKWCAAPLGTGFLYIKRNLIAKTHPLFAHYEHLPDADTITKFENLGTITPVFNAAIKSLDFWDELGFELKVKRMQYLKRYWTQRSMELPNVEIVTNINEKHSCGLAFFKIKGKSSTDVKNVLWKEHRIKVLAIENYKNNYVDYEDVNVLGIATPVFITIKELDKLIQTMERIIAPKS
ncbi:MAG: aminotransferase class V-fold PLP-dependent enzyme [Pyrinomonadaceae bacterium]|nr:aminotransferase class V-fold PLP-dependent enzyme [Pyrinomonadaceae bacterium]